VAADSHGKASRRGMPALPLVFVGVLGGLAWSAALRAYMVELAGATSAVEWAGTFLAVLLPGAATGGLLAWAEVLRRRGAGAGRRWLSLAPLTFTVATMSMPGALEGLLTQGLGGGAIGIPLFAIAGGYALSGRGALVARLACAAVGVVFLAALVVVSSFMGGGRLALSEPRGAWVAVLICSLLALLATVTAIPFRPDAAPATAPSARV
jgi:hypothetical protein